MANIVRGCGKAPLSSFWKHRPVMTSAQNLSAESFKVEHDKDNNEFFIKLGKDKAVLQYDVIDPKTLDLVHTEVPASLRGKGIAKHLAKAAFDHLVAENLQARLSCTYLVKYYYDTQDPVYMKHVVK
ncbi:protein NATD1 isoform X2 [Haemaphysalis longicornis]